MRAHLLVDIPTPAGTFARYTPVTVTAHEKDWATVALIDQPHQLVERVPLKCISTGRPPYRRRCVYCERELMFTRTTVACVSCINFRSNIGRAS